MKLLLTGSVFESFLKSELKWNHVLKISLDVFLSGFTSLLRIKNEGKIKKYK